MPGRSARRRPARRWVAAGALLVLAGTATALSTRRHWSACGPDVSSRSCLDLQEVTSGLPLWGPAGHRDPLGTALAGLAALLLGLAWVTVSGWARGNPGRLALALLVAAQPLLVSLLVAVELAGPGRGYPLTLAGWSTWPAEVLVLPMFLGAGWILEEELLPTVRLILLGWAVTSFGPCHGVVDHVLTTVLGHGRGDSPLGLGYVTAATQVVLGVVVVVLSLLLAGPGRRGEEDGEEWEGRDGFTLAA